MAANVLIQCPECERDIKAPESVVGKKVRCKHCQATFVAKKSKAKPTDKKAQKPAPSPAADDEEDANPYGVTTLDLTPRCPNCANEMEDEHAIVCLHCGYNTQTREQFRTRKVLDTSVGEQFTWLLPGIACVLLILGAILFDIMYLMKIQDWVDENEWYGFLLCHGGIKLWVVIISLFVIYFAGKFAIKRLIIHHAAPEVEKKK
jgi:hypothetical protein